VSRTLPSYFSPNPKSLDVTHASIASIACDLRSASLGVARARTERRDDAHVVVVVVAR